MNRFAKPLVTPILNTSYLISFSPTGRSSPLNLANLYVDICVWVAEVANCVSLLLGLHLGSQGQVFQAQHPKKTNEDPVGSRPLCEEPHSRSALLSWSTGDLGGGVSLGGHRRPSLCPNPGRIALARAFNL